MYVCVCECLVERVFLAVFALHSAFSISFLCSVSFYGNFYGLLCLITRVERQRRPKHHQHHRQQQQQQHDLSGHLWVSFCILRVNFESVLGNIFKHFAGFRFHHFLNKLNNLL